MHHAQMKWVERLASSVSKLERQDLLHELEAAYGGFKSYEEMKRTCQMASTKLVDDHVSMTVNIVDGKPTVQFQFTKVHDPISETEMTCYFFVNEFGVVDC